MKSREKGACNTLNMKDERHHLDMIFFSHDITKILLKVALNTITLTLDMVLQGIIIDCLDRSLSCKI